MFNTKTKGLAVLNEKDYIALTHTSPNLSQLKSEFIAELYEQEFIVDDDRDELSEIKYCYWKEKFERNVLHLTIMPTLRCNFNCIYCFEEHQEIDMDMVSIKRVQNMVKNLIRKGYKKLTVDWYGGEPLLNLTCIKELSEYFIKLCDKLGIMYTASITTNGYAFTPSVQNELFALKVVDAQLTIDGDKETHDKRRACLSGEGSYDVIKYNLENSHPDIAISVRVNVDKNNVSSLNSILDLLEKLGRNNTDVYACIVTPSLQGTYEVGTYGTLMSSIIDFYNFATSSHLKVSRTHCMITDQYAACIVDSDSHYIISPDCKIYKCGESYNEADPGKVGLISEDGSLSLDLSQIAKWTKDPFAIQECKECKFLPICMGGCVMKRLTRMENNCSWEFKDRPHEMVELLYMVVQRGTEKQESHQ